MWLLTAQGFYSVVQHRDNPNFLLVRGRVREDLEALARLIPGLDVLETPDADYRWRAIVTRAQWQTAAAALAAEIDYPNFKRAVANRQGSGRAHLYFDVWTALRVLDPGEGGGG